MRAELQITSDIEAMPIAMVAQSVNILLQNAETLRETIDDFMLSNPMLDFSVTTSNTGAFDILQVAAPCRTTLVEHLKMQLQFSHKDRELLRVGGFIIESLDRDGYLRDNVEELIKAVNTTHGRFMEALSAVQALEPCGVGARSLGECLRLQLEAMEKPYSLAIEIVTSHLEEFAAGTLRLEGCSDEEIARAGRLIRSLQPRPGLEYDHDNSRYIIPDIRVEIGEHGKLEAVLINQPAIPSISSRYAEFLRTENEEQRQYVQDNLLYARSFIYALRERANTLQRIAGQAVERQSEYILTGMASSLRPMTLTSIASGTKLGLSTVSRAVSNKHIEFRGRVFPLRALFTSGGSAGHSRDAILCRIKELLGAVPDGGSLSDIRISEILDAEGIQISRRTVNKYRNTFLKSSIDDSASKRRTAWERK